MSVGIIDIFMKAVTNNEKWKLINTGTNHRSQGTLEIFNSCCLEN
ncbi:hypothetical protein [Sediminicola arcticus]|uniref:Uncharacterized protein n=1 Tax=Sediminicola arcticus TaxID=1574308 RepID=A0ABV2SS02_9FLAO